MADLEIFVLIVVPVTIVALCAAGLWVQARANRATRVLVNRLADLNER